MQRRPQPSPRRGLLRAIIAGVILVVIIIAIVLVVSSLTAPPAKAPTVPVTPTPPSLTPSASPTPSVKAGATSGTHATPSATKKKDIALSDRPPGLAMRMFSRPPSAPEATAAPRGGRVAYFAPFGGAYARTPLKIWNRATGATRTISFGDRFVRPVWSPDGTRILFARVEQTPAYPGARWTLLEVNVQTGRVRVLDSQNGLNLLPLGWRSGRPLYLVSTATDTGIFTIYGGTRHYISIMMPQVITAAFLSKDSKYIAFAAPSDCFFCTYDTFNLDMLHPLVGPSGGQSENNIAWSRDGDNMAVPLKDRIGIVSAETVSVLGTYPVPAGLPAVWIHPMTFRRNEHTLTLVDSVTHSTYTSTR